MIISHQRKFIFVHAPKTGGTSLALALESRAAKDDILIGDTPKAKRRRGRLNQLQPAGRLWKHSTLSDIAGVVDPAEYFVLTLVRNPWDRAVSYYHWLQGQNFQHPAVALAQSFSFSDFLNHEVIQRGFEDNPYASYVTDAKGVQHCDLFARLEDLDADLAPFWNYLGFSCSVDRINTSARQQDWQGYYDDADAALIARICAVDIATFGYKFDSIPLN